MGDGKNWKKNRRKKKKKEPEAATEEFLALGTGSEFTKMSGDSPLWNTGCYIVTEAPPQSRMQAPNRSNPLLADYSQVGLPGPSSSGPASGCSILGRVATVADIPSPLEHCLPPSSGAWMLLANIFKIFPGSQCRRQVVPFDKYLRYRRRPTDDHTRLQNLFGSQVDGKVRW